MSALWRRGLGRTDVVATVAVVGIGAMLFVPHAMSARQVSAQFRTMDHIRTVADGITRMATDDRFYSPSYVFGSDRTSTAWDIEDQGVGNPQITNGHVHFSAWLLERGYVGSEEAFTSSAAPRGGAPRTNPGPDLEDWESWQINDLGQTGPAAIPFDRQAARMAFTGNHAVMPRNKFRVPFLRRNEQVRHPGEPAGTPGPDRLTRAAEIIDPSSTCLLTEFHYSDSVGWRTLAGSGTRVCKSHRPITPFLGRSAGIDVYSEGLGLGEPRFRYPTELEIFDDGDVPAAAIDSSRSSINAMGRLQPGGRAHMAMVDGSVLLKRPVESVTERLWGEHFYSITGPEAVFRP